MHIISMAVALFFILNALGNIPVFVGVLANYPAKKQRRIIFRELTIGLFILMFFNFFGEFFLNLIGINHAAIGIAGGILLFLISLSMIFPRSDTAHDIQREPFIFPLAVPMFSGPGAIASVMVYSQQTQNPFIVGISIFLAWLASLIILLISSNIRHLLGPRGLMACERLGGMLIALIAVHMVINGYMSVLKECLRS